MTVKTTTRMIVRCMMKDSSVASSTHYAARHRPTKRWMLYLEVGFFDVIHKPYFQRWHTHSHFRPIYTPILYKSPFYPFYIYRTRQWSRASSRRLNTARSACSLCRWVGRGERGRGGRRRRIGKRKEERGEEMNLLQPLVMCVVWCTHCAVSVVLYRSITIQVHIY